MMSAVGIVLIVIAAVVGLGWVIPLVAGIVRLKRGTGGVALTVVGGIWCLFAVSIGLFAYVVSRQVSTARNVEAFNPAAYQGPTGKIVVPHQGDCSLEVYATDGASARKRLQLSGKDGVLVAPVGTYVLGSCDLTARDAANREWSASCYPGSSSGRISVTANAPVNLDVGPPFTASVKVHSQGKSQVGMDYQLTGRGGHSYTIEKNSGADDPPGFQVLDSSGKEVWHGTFAYG
jgi:hypothetical protein